MKRFEIILPCLLAVLIFTGCKEVVEDPSLTFPETVVEVTAEGGIVSVAYNLKNPSPSLELSAATEDEWIDGSSFDFSESGIMKFIVFENTGQDAREGFVNVTYGSFQERLRVVQTGSAGEDPEPQEQELELEVLALTDSSVTCSITPLDENLTYCCMAVLREEFDQYAGGSLETFYTMMLDNYELFASQEQMTLEDFLSTYILMSGYQEFTIPDMIYNTEYLLVYVGMDSKGTQLTDIFSESVTTEDIERVDMSFDISYEQDYSELLMKVVPSKDEVPYFFNVVPQNVLDADGITVEEWNQAQIDATVAFLKQFYGLTDMREILEDYIGVSYGPDEYFWENDETEYYDGSLLLGLDYVGAAFALDMEGRINSEVTVKPFRTPDAAPSSNRFTVTFDNLNIDYAEFTVECTNNDTWYYVCGLASDYAGMSDEEILASFEYKYDESDGRIFHRGSYSGRLNILSQATDYVLFVFGYDHGMVTTGLTKAEFTTLEPGDPAKLTFDFSVEYEPSETDPSEVLASVTVKGEPATALFWTDMFSEDAAEEHVIAKIEEGVQQFEGWGMSRVDYFRGMGERGSYTYPYPVTPGTRFKMAAVGIYEDTGEYATDIVFSEVFEVPADGVASAVSSGVVTGRNVEKPVGVSSIHDTEELNTQEEMPELLKRILAAKARRQVKSGMRMLLPEK